MPTFISGSQAVITFDNTAGTPTDMSTTISKVTLDANSNVASFFTFGTNVAYKTEGKRTYMGSVTYPSAEDTSSMDYTVSAWFHPGASNTMGTKTLQVDTPDSSAASYRYSGEIRAKDANVVNQDAGGDGTPAMKVLSFEWDSEPTRTMLT
jgi:hypothetical protein